jgi:hypothetical protein
MQETMMTEATQATEGAEASTPAADGGATAAPESGQQQATEGQQGAEATTEAKPQGAPENYEFAFDEGVSVADGVLESFKGVAKELNLPNEAAQKVLNQMAPAIQAHQSAQLEAMRNEWATAATTDTEFGGEKLQENLSVAKKALDTFGTPELRKLLNESGLGNHPEIIRAFYRAGKATSEDGFVAGGSAAQGNTDARRLYSVSNMNP